VQHWSFVHGRRRALAAPGAYRRRARPHAHLRWPRASGSHRRRAPPQFAAICAPPPAAGERELPRARPAAARELHHRIRGTLVFRANLRQLLTGWTEGLRIKIKFLSSPNKQNKQVDLKRDQETKPNFY
jgi:hypothetical protein